MAKGENAAEFLHSKQRTWSFLVRIHSSAHCTDYRIQSADSSIVLLTDTKNESRWLAPDSTLLPSPVSDADRKERSTGVSSSEKERESQGSLSPPETWLTLTGETVLTYILQTSNTWALACRRHRWTTPGKHAHAQTQSPSHHAPILVSVASPQPEEQSSRAYNITTGLSPLCARMQPRPAVTPED